MDWRVMSEKLYVNLKKYRYALLVIFAGIILISIPDRSVQQKNHPVEASSVSVPDDLQSELEEILNHLDGAGHVRVLLTKSAGEEILYQVDENRNDTSSTKIETVIITDSQRTQNGLIRQVNPPIYMGAIILCQGADNPNVCYCISKAVASATGLTFDKIAVLKIN